MAIVKKYNARVAHIAVHGEGVYSLDLQSTGKPFHYYPGQFLHLALDEYDPAGAWPESRCFSMQTPPGSDRVRITYAVKGKFTARMESELACGAPVTLKLPYGDLFTQDHNRENTVFIAGGTGITPFLSLFNDSSFKSYVNPLLFAGFRNRAMNFYGPELEMAGEINSGFTVRCFYENEEGLINPAEVLAANGHSFFVSGPPAMISFFKQSLLSQHVAPAQIKTDDWG